MAGTQRDYGRYESAAGLARAALAALGVVTFVGLLRVGSAWMQLRSYKRIGEGLPNPDEEFAAIFLREAVLLGIWILTCLVTSILFLCWVNRAARNAWALRRESMTISPGWCVGYHFVPLLNLIRPFDAMREIWHASAPGDGPPPRRTSIPALLGCWWVAWIIYNLFRWFLGESLGETAPQVINGTEAELFIRLLGCVAAVLALAVVHRVNARQEEARLMGGADAAVFT